MNPGTLLFRDEDSKDATITDVHHEDSRNHFRGFWRSSRRKRRSNDTQVLNIYCQLSLFHTHCFNESGAIVAAGLSQGKSSALGYDTRFDAGNQSDAFAVR